MLTDDRTSRWAVVLRVLLVLIAAGALVLIGRMTAPDQPPPRFMAGVPVGFTRTQAGARAAALTYATSRARAILLAPQHRRIALNAIATPRFAAVADREDQARDLAPLSGQEAGRYLITALGSRLDGFTDQRARLTVWLFQVWAADTAVGSFSTQTVELVWQENDWRLDRQIDSPVQAVPQITQRPRFAQTRELVAELGAPRFGRP